MNVQLYLHAFLMSIAVFGAGIYVGFLLDSWNLHGIESEVANISERVASAQLLLINEGNQSYCPLYKRELDSIDTDVEKIGYKLTYLEDEKHIFDDELKRKYFILEAESYALSKKTGEVCGDPSILLIHFYSNKGCERCTDQGSEILKMRDNLRSQGVDVKLFSFDGTLGSPIAEALEIQYSIDSYPSIVIGDKAYSGFMSQDSLERIAKAAG